MSTTTTTTTTKTDTDLSATLIEATITYWDDLAERGIDPAGWAADILRDVGDIPSPPLEDLRRLLEEEQRFLTWAVACHTLEGGEATERQALASALSVAALAGMLYLHEDGDAIDRIRAARALDTLDEVLIDSDQEA